MIINQFSGLLKLALNTNQSINQSIKLVFSENKMYGPSPCKDKGHTCIMYWVVSARCNNLDRGIPVNIQ